jgi:hypothetical protein
VVCCRPNVLTREASEPDQSCFDCFIQRSVGLLPESSLIRSGAGIGVCQAVIARRDDSIVRLFPRQFSLQMETWITVHEDLRNSPRCRVTFDALVKCLRQYINNTIV